VLATRLTQQGAAEAEAYFERALAVARAQQAKSWELRAGEVLVIRAKTSCLNSTDEKADACGNPWQRERRADGIELAMRLRSRLPLACELPRFG
jgi:hypothetical protein